MPSRALAAFLILLTAFGSLLAPALANAGMHCHQQGYREADRMRVAGLPGTHEQTGHHGPAAPGADCDCECTCATANGCAAQALPSDHLPPSYVPTNLRAEPGMATDRALKRGPPPSPPPIAILP